MTTIGEMMGVKDLLRQIGVVGIDAVRAFRNQVFALFAKNGGRTGMGACFVEIYNLKANELGAPQTPHDAMWGTVQHDAMIDLIDHLLNPTQSPS